MKDREQSPRSSAPLKPPLGIIQRRQANPDKGTNVPIFHPVAEIGKPLYKQRIPVPAVCQ